MSGTEDPIEIPDDVLASAVRDYARNHGMLFEIKDVEIFSVGEWNGDKYTEQDLDDMVAAFDEVGFRPPVKLGHAEESGSPAFGWIKSLKRKGDKLVADFMDLPEKIFEAIKDRRFDTVSSEIFWNVKRNGKKFRRVLKAVALLGAETPGVSFLKPLREAFNTEFSADELALVHTYQLSPEEPEMSNETVAELREQIAEMQSSVEAMKAENEELKAQGDVNPVQFKALQDEITEMRTRAAAAEEASRKATLAAKIERVKIPVLRSHFEALYDLAYGIERTVKFTVGDKETQASAIDVIDDLVARVNDKSAWIFTQTSGADNFDRSENGATDDPQAEMGRLIEAFIIDHKMDIDSAKDYAQAMKMVLKDPKNAEVVQAYHTSRN